ncbi:MAG: hypothetical protein K6E34_05620 [Lachnospiraceae bacterium]|nr:hypothetical protein [Lachnospiraceae bacterium]
MLNKGIKKLSDDILEEVTGGAAFPRHTDAYLAKAGVVIDEKNGKKTYSVEISTGVFQPISENVAMGIGDCYKLSGGQQLTESQLKDLIKQSC